MKKERLLITGGAGYLGSVMAGHFLNRGHNVTCLDNLSLGHTSLLHLVDNANFDFIYGIRELIKGYNLMFKREVFRQ